MRRFLVAVSIFLVAAAPGDVVPELEANGYYVEPGSNATDQVVSDAVFQARSDGGRLYIVVLADEPPGGATTFSDSVLDRLDEGYVVTVAPETVGFAGDGSFWTSEQMNDAVDASLGGGTDDEVVRRFVAQLTGGAPVPSDAEDEPTQPGGSGIPGWVWLLLLAGGALVVFSMIGSGSRRRSELAAAELARVKAMARDKLAEIANDIIAMEDEVTLSANPEIIGHYQRASAIYAEVHTRVEANPDAREMVEVIRELDNAIWELDAAEALLDGNQVPEKPSPPEAKSPVPTPQPEAAEEAPVGQEGYHRRPERQSSYAGNDLMSALWALIAMTGRGSGWGGIPGGFGGPMGGGGSGRMRGGGLRGLGGRMRGGGRRG